MAHGDLMERAFSTHFVFRHVTWGVAPGWFESAPLALSEASSTRSNAARNRDTNTTAPFVTRRKVPVTPKVSSNADAVAQPGSANNPMAGCATSWSLVFK